MIENVIETTENCRYCLMCRHVAPLYRISAGEALTPHGIALTVASQRRGLIEWTPETIDVIFSETDGGNARAHCVFDQPHEEAIAAVRAELVALGLAPAAVYAAGEQLREHQSLYGMAQPSTSVTSDTALFVGDEAIYLWPTALEAATELLKLVDTEPVLIGQGLGNGFVAASLGFTEIAADLLWAIQDTVAASQATRLFVLGPGDYYVLTQMATERLGIAWSPDVTVVDLVSYLAEKLAEGTVHFTQSTDTLSWAYVDPTHAVRVPGRFESPRQLAAAVLSGTQHELFWRRERAHPVGNTGLQIAQPELAEQLTRARLEDARSSGAKLLVCEDPSTLATLDSLAAEYGLEVCGLYELLVEHIV